MKSFFLIIAFIILTFAVTANAEEVKPDLLFGRWISMEVIKPSENEGIGKGWVLTFGTDSQYYEQIDEGFGIVEEWSGTFDVTDNFITLHRNGFRYSRRFSISLEEDRLQLTRHDIDSKPTYTVTFKRSQKEHPELTKLPRLPRSKAEAVEILKQKMKPEELSELAKKNNKEDLVDYHFGLGMYIRNAFGLWRGNKALLDDCSNGEHVHPDTVSMIIIEALWEDLRKNNIEE